MGAMRHKGVFTALKILLGILLILIVILASQYAYSFSYRLYNNPAVSASPGRNVTVEVDSREGDMALAKMLKQNGLIEDTALFCVQMRLFGYHGKVIDGTYVLNTSQTSRQMMETITTASTEEEEEQ
jgi:cell division protein YceG involved in septum cleavage